MSRRFARVRESWKIESVQDSEAASRAGTKHTCPACGSSTVRASICEVCGKIVGEGFQPLDAIRSSSRIEGRPLAAAQPVRLDNDDRPELANDAAWACAVYSMVPYLGILFAPLAIVIGGIKYLRREPGPVAGHRRTGLMAMVAGVVLLCFQVFLWWLLYIIPELQR